MAGMSIWDRFEMLEYGTGSDAVLAALPLPGTRTHYLAKGCAGEPVLLLKVQKRRIPRIPLGLRHVQVEFEVDCTVLDGEVANGSVAATFCRAVCDPTAPGLHPLFIHALSGAVERLPSRLSPGDVDSFFDDAVELFRCFSAPAKTSVLGLWGELLVIVASPDRNLLVSGWHVTPEQTFDFAFPRAHVEVKTTTRHNRQHEFSLNQVRGGHIQTIVASLVVEQSDAGENVYELGSSIQDGLAAHNRAKLWRLVAQSVGSEADGAGDVRFLRIAALNSLCFYNAENLPAPEISPSSAPCISAVRFSLDLDKVPAIQTLKLKEVWRIIGQGLDGNAPDIRE